MPAAARLDRLSALMQGLAPRVPLMERGAPGVLAVFDPSPVEGLYLHVLTHGQVRLDVQGWSCPAVQAPAMLVCRADAAHSIAGVSGEKLHGLMSARVFFDGPGACLLLREFSTPLVIQLENADPSLKQIIELIGCEWRQPRCGYPALMERAGEILFIGLLRHLVAQPLTLSGLFNGLADPRIARTLVAMHTRPESPWTLDSLARQAGMSRTSFATKFREVMRLPAGKYLEILRLAIASRVIQSGQGLKKAAGQSGYTSTSALSRALSRTRARQDMPVERKA